MKKLLFSFFALLSLTACQHGIEPDDLEFPPDASEITMTTNMTAEEAAAELKQINETPYPAYTVQGGDIFRVRVYNEEDLNPTAASTTMVTPDGYLTIELAGPVYVKDLTIIEATAAVEKALSKYVRYPKVSLSPTVIIGKSATILGAIQQPGRYAVSDSIRVSDMIAMGKGFTYGLLNGDTVDLSDISRSYIIRDDKILPINFDEAVVKGNQMHNIKVFPNDIIFIARREDSRVIMMGEVKNPRPINWREGMTFLDALAYCEGLAPDYWGTAIIMRKPRVAKVDGQLELYKFKIDDVLSGKSRNFKLASGDIVYIPKDSLGEYNIFVNKLMPTAQLVNQLTSPVAYWLGGR